MVQIIRGIVLRIKEDVRGFLGIVAISGLLSIGHVILPYLFYTIFIQLLSQETFINIFYDFNSSYYVRPKIIIIFGIVVVSVLLLLFTLIKAGIIMYFHEGVGDSSSVMANFWGNCKKRFKATLFASIIQYTMSLLPYIIFSVAYVDMASLFDNSVRPEDIIQNGSTNTFAIVGLFMLILTFTLFAFSQFISYEAIISGNRLKDNIIQAFRKAKIVFWETIFIIILHTVIQFLLLNFEINNTNLFILLTLVQFLVWLAFTVFIFYPFYILASQRLEQRNAVTTGGNPFGELIDSVDESKPIGVTQAQYDDLIKKIEQGEVDERSVSKGDIKLYDKLLEQKMKSNKNKTTD